MASYKQRCTFAVTPQTTRGVPLVLGADPKGENFLYTHDKTVIIRDVEDMGKCDLYTEHSYPVRVAKYSPSRFYIASGDKTGKVRVWDTVNKEHVLKCEYPVLGGAVKDIAWDAESKRLAIAGEGKESFAKCITMDTGTTLGNLHHATKAINSVAYKSTRPYRVAMGGEDFKVQFFEGPPFKHNCEKRDHTNFVQAVRYSPNGEVFITGGSDKRALIYDGKTAELIGSLGGTNGELDAEAHNGGIYAIDFSPDGSEILTVSGDKTAKIWNVASRQLVQEFVLGTDIKDMQVGCLWMGSNLITISLSGYINFLDRNNPSTPRKIIKGHNKPVVQLALSEGKDLIYTAGNDGLILCWDAKTGLCEEIQGKGHSTMIQDIVVRKDTFVTISVDDTIRYNNAKSNEYSPDATKLPSQPKAVALKDDGTAVVACVKHIVVVVSGNIMFQQENKFEALSVDIHPGGLTVAVGGSDKKIHIYQLNGYTLQETTSFLCGEKDCQLAMAQQALDLKYSPDGQHLAAVGSERMTLLIRCDDPQTQNVVLKGVKKHTARVDRVAWCPDSDHFATGSLDQTIIIWSIEDFKKLSSNPLVIQPAHKLSHISGLAWVNQNLLVSSGNDSNIKQWEISY